MTRPGTAGTKNNEKLKIYTKLHENNAIYEHEQEARRRARAREAAAAAEAATAAAAAGIIRAPSESSKSNFQARLPSESDVQEKLVEAEYARAQPYPYEAGAPADMGPDGSMLQLAQRLGLHVTQARGEQLGLPNIRNSGHGSGDGSG